jgi:hypothetical protein
MIVFIYKWLKNAPFFVGGLHHKEPSRGVLGCGRSLWWVRRKRDNPTQSDRQQQLECDSSGLGLVRN